MFRKILIRITILSIALVTVGFNTSAKAADRTISVKLSNYIGNQSSLNIVTTGNYKVQGITNIRLAGKDRFEVAVNVSKQGWSTSNTVILANYLAFADALAATPLAYSNNSPVLLTHPTKLTDMSKAEIQRLKATKVIIVGGPGSVSDNVVKQLRDMKIAVERIGGIDRYEVASNIASKLPKQNTTVIANGLAFADALSIAPYAASKGYPILLTKVNDIPQKTKTALSNNTIVVGGEGSVSPTVYNQLPGRQRIGGKDRYEVSANVIRQLNLNPSHGFVATGLTFADALTGSVLAAKKNAPMLLTRLNDLPAPIQNIIDEKMIDEFTILGGTGSVSNKVAEQLSNLLPGVAYTLKAENNRLALYKGKNKVKDFSSPFVIVPDKYGTSSRVSINNREYLGVMEFNIENGYIRPINKNIPFEDYLKGVVPREMPATWHLEALKAQAIAARTFSIDEAGKQTVLDNQSYQVYGGYDWHPNTNKAVEDTKGQVLTYNGKLIGAFFSSSNGGMTESNANEWGSDPLPYLPVKYDSFDTDYKWDYVIQKQQINMNGKSLKNPGHWWWDASAIEQNLSLANNIKDWLKKNGYPNADMKITGIPNIAINEKYSSGRAKYITASLEFYVYPKGEYAVVPGTEIQKQTKDMKVTATEFRRMVGTMDIKSTLFNPIASNSKDITLSGKGFGHGVGMSQHGANNRGKAGQTYKQILDFYYPGTKLEKQ